MSDLSKLADAVFKGNFAGVKDITQELIQDGVDPLVIINEGLIGGMNIVAPKFKSGEMFVPEVMMSAKALHNGLDLVKPLIADTDIPSAGTVVMGTVAGDLHDIGKNLVTMILESGGFKVVDIGVNVAPEGFVEAIKKYNPQIVGLSALLTTTMKAMEQTIVAIQDAGLRDKVKIVVGGAPISQEFADEIGADGYGADAMSAQELCLKYLAQN